MLTRTSCEIAQHEEGACSCCPPQLAVRLQEPAPPVRASDSSRWHKIRSGLLFAVACITSPCCTPLLVPLGLALLAGTPVAVWLSAHIGWVYAGLTLVSVVSLIVALRWLNRKPAASHVHLVNIQSIPIRSISGGLHVDHTPSQSTETVIACDLTAIDAADRDQHMLTGKQLFASVTEVQELADGYAFRLPAETHILHSAAHFIANERLCCPFFDFTLKVGAKNGLWLSLTGGDGVREFVHAEFASLVKVPIAAS